MQTITREAPAAMRREHRQKPPRICSRVAALVAARSEADGSIQLLIADPYGRPHRMLVELPAAGADACTDDPMLRARIDASRETFIRELVLPSFEGFVLLYGTARLTLALHDDGGPATPHVLDLELLDGDPAPCACIRDGRRSA